MNSIFIGTVQKVDNYCISINTRVWKCAKSLPQKNKNLWIKSTFFFFFAKTRINLCNWLIEKIPAPNSWVLFFHWIIIKAGIFECMLKKTGGERVLRNLQILKETWLEHMRGLRRRWRLKCYQGEILRRKPG